MCGYAYYVLLVGAGATNCRGFPVGRSVLGCAVVLLYLGRLIEMQGAPLCVLGFCSCVRVGLLVTMPSLVLVLLLGAWCCSVWCV